MLRLRLLILLVICFTAVSGYGTSYAESAPLSQATVGAPPQGWSPDDVGAISEERSEFSPADEYVLIELTWNFRPEDVGDAELMLTVWAPGSPDPSQAAFPIEEVTEEMVGGTYSIYWYFHLHEQGLADLPGEWRTTHHFNGREVAELSFWVASGD